MTSGSSSGGAPSIKSGVAGAVLAGGASRRMGRDKSLIEIDGTPMVVRVASVLEAAGCSPVAVVGGDEVTLRSLGLRRIDDAWPGEGPLGGIITALRWARGPVLVTACDLPDLSTAAIRTLIDRGAGPARDSLGRPTHRAAPDVVVGHASRLEPLLALWSPSALPVLEEWFVARGERAVHSVLENSDRDGLTVERVAVEPAALRNVNSPFDLPGHRSS